MHPDVTWSGRCRFDGPPPLVGLEELYGAGGRALVAPRLGRKGCRLSEDLVGTLSDVRTAALGHVGRTALYQVALGGRSHRSPVTSENTQCVLQVLPNRDGLVTEGAGRFVALSSAVRGTPEEYRRS